MSNEVEYQKKIYNYLHEKFPDEIKIDKENVNLDMEVPIPYGFSFSPKTKITDMEMIVYCYNQDICFFKELFDKKDKNTLLIRNSNDKDNNNEINVNFQYKFEQLNKLGKVGVPFVILEVKLRGKDKNKESPTTGDIIAYNNKAQDIKSIFPFVQYGFIVVGETPPRVYQHGYAFDKIISLSYEEVENMNFNESFLKEINKMLKESVKRFKSQYK